MWTIEVIMSVLFPWITSHLGAVIGPQMTSALFTFSGVNNGDVLSNCHMFVA
jgi:hypothetical protein